LLAAAPLVQERMTVLSEAVGMLSFLFVDSENLVIEDDARQGLPENAAEVLAAAIGAIESIAEFNAAELQQVLSNVLIEQMELKPKFAFGALRTAISGRRVSPPLFESMEILGKEETLKRLASFARSV
jgi:glutamyl-tRNA synthetase